MAKYKPSALGILTPPDGLSDLEVQLQRTLMEESLALLYAKLPTARMKFIVAAHFDLGYSQELVARILNIKQPSLQDEIKHIKRVLRGDPYKPHRRNDKVSTEDVINTMILLAQK